MNLLPVLVSLCVIWSSEVCGKLFKLDYDLDDYKKVIREFVEHKVADNKLHHQNSKKLLKLNSFSWKNCGSASDPVQIQKLSLGPDPVKIPGNVTVSGSGTIKQSLTAPLQVDLEIKKKVLFWIPIPCIDNVGSCSYSDICAMIAKIQCPPDFIKYHIPCKCPVNAGTYNLLTSHIQISPISIPSWLEDGDYQITATIKMGGKEMGCIYLALSLSN